MAETLSGKLAESVFSFALGKGKEKASSFIADKQNEQEMKKAIRTFLDDFCEKELPYLSWDEEFDFKKLSGFLRDSQNRLEEYFYAKIGERSAVLEVLRSEALAHAEPRGQSGRRLVLGCLDAVLATIEAVLLKRVDTKDWFLAVRTGEQLRQAVEKIVKEQAESIHRHIDYKGSFAELVDEIDTNLSDDSLEYHYKNPKIRFFGRDPELSYLDDFLDDEEAFLYTVITGPGGIGKSKLLCHYVQINECDAAWKMIYPSRASMEGLYSHMGEFSYPKNLLVVVDYVGQYPEEIGKWMAKILGSQHRPPKMRLVLLERPSPEQDTKPEWYKKLVDRPDKLQRCLWQNRFYEMKPLGREALLALMDNIAEQKHKTLSGQNKQDIYERVCSFHHEEAGGSPLYTILTTDAFLNRIPLTSLDTNKLMEYVLDRDEKYWETTICGGDKELYRCFREMLVYATATDGWDFTLLGEPLTKASEYLTQISDAEDDEVWGKFPQVLRENEKEKIELKPLEPDLIGEYFVLDFLRKKAKRKDKIKSYQQRIGLFWEKPLPYAYFLNRCVDSYLYQPEFQCLLHGEKTVFWDNEGNDLAAYLSALLIVDLIIKQDPSAGSKSVTWLEKLWKAHRECTGNEEIAFALKYAQGLVNLIANQDTYSSLANVKQLEMLSTAYPRNEAIALEYAKGLVNLSNGQDIPSFRKSVKCLRALAEEHPRNQAIPRVYTQRVKKPTVNKNAIAKTETIEQLIELWEEYAGNKEIIFQHLIRSSFITCGASCALPNFYVLPILYSLSYNLNLVGSKVSVKKLRKLSEDYPGNEKIAILYAEGVARLCTQESTKNNVIQECRKFYIAWQSDSAAVKQKVSTEPDSNMKTLKSFLLEHSELFPKFMEWLLS